MVKAQHKTFLEICEKIIVATPKDKNDDERGAYHIISFDNIF